MSTIAENNNENKSEVLRVRVTPKEKELFCIEMSKVNVTPSKAIRAFVKSYIPK